MAQRILVVVRSLKIGGMEKVAVNLCDGLAFCGHEAHLLSFKNAEPVVEPTHPDVFRHQVDLDKINRLSVIGLLYDLFVRVPLNLIIRKSGFIWRGLYAAPIFRWYVRRLERRYGHFDKIIVRGQGTFENLWRLRDPRIYICLENNINLNPDSWKARLFARALYQGKNIICVSTGVKKNFEAFASRAGIVAATVQVITNPMPIEHIRALADEPDEDLPDEPYIVNVARLVPQKDQQLLLRAYAKSGISEHLVIVGGGPLEGELKALANELGVGDRVTFTGTLMNPYPWMKHARLFVLSSRVEGLGIVLVESLACGTPVVAVDCPGGIRDVLVEELVDYLAVAEPDDLARMIHKGLESPPVIKEQWVSRFEAKSVVQAFIDLPN